MAKRSNKSEPVTETIPQDEVESLYNEGETAGDAVVESIGSYRSTLERIRSEAEANLGKLTMAIDALTAKRDALQAELSAITPGSAPASVGAPGRKRRAGRPKGSKNASKGPKAARKTSGKTKRALAEVKPAAIVEACSGKSLTDKGIADALGVTASDVAPIRKALFADGRLTNAGGKGRGTKYRAA